MKHFELGRNYRSTKTIVDAAQKMVKLNKERLDTNIFTTNKQGCKIAYISKEDGDGEANTIANTIKAVRRSGYNYKDIAILYRMSFLSRSLEKEFLKKHIPYNIISGLPFYARMEIKDIMAYLRLLTNPRDMVSLIRAINTPKRGLGEKTVDKVIAACKDAEIRDILDLTKAMKGLIQTRIIKGKIASKLLSFVAVLEQVKVLSDNPAMSVSSIVKKVIELTNYYQYIEDISKKPDEKDDRYGNVLELINIASSYTDLVDFVSSMMEDNVTAASNDEEAESNPDQVQMMTMHASKGLEFPVVIIVDATQNITPHWRAMVDGNIEEERRLFYVAMTRAKEMLFITRAKYMTSKGVPMLTKQSQFIKEIEDQYLEIR